MASSRSCSSEGRSTSPQALHHESTLLMYLEVKKKERKYYFYGSISPYIERGTLYIRVLIGGVAEGECKRTVTWLDSTANGCSDFPLGCGSGTQSPEVGWGMGGWALLERASAVNRTLGVCCSWPHSNTILPVCSVLAGSPSPH